MVEKKRYSAPRLVEYGCVTELTLGSGGMKPDFQVINGQLVDTNTSCSDPGTTFACLVS